MEEDKEFIFSQLSDFQAGKPIEPQPELSNDWEHLQHFAEMGKLLSGAAHDINNQLMLALSYLNLLMDSRKSEAADKQNLATVLDSVLYCTRLLNQMFHQVRRGQVAMEPVSLVETLNHSIKMVMVRREFQTPAIRIIQNYDLSTPSVRGDSLQLKRMFINLIQNACIAIQEFKTGSTIRIRLWHSEEYVYTEISDNGPGLPEFVFLKAGEPLYSTRLEQGGSGLGLMIVHQIVKLHGGKILMENPVEGGAKFLISLPLREA